MNNDELQTYGILLRRPGSDNVYVGPDFIDTENRHVGSDPRCGSLDEWAISLAPSLDGWTIGYGAREDVLADALKLRAEINAAIAVLEDDREPPCKHRQAALAAHRTYRGFVPFRWLARARPPFPCAECETEEHAAWITGVEAKFTAAIEAIRRGEMHAWRPGAPADEEAFNAAGLTKYAPDWSPGPRDAILTPDKLDDGYPPLPVDGDYDTVKRYANVRVLAEMARSAEDAEERFVGSVQRKTPGERWARAERTYDVGVNLNQASLRRFLPPPPNTNGDPMSDEDLDWQGMIRDRIAQGLAAPIDDPEADDFRRKLLAGAEISVGEDGRLSVAETADVPEPARCREHPVSGTWMHVTPHDGCPPYLRGAKRNVRRMRP